MNMIQKHFLNEIQQRLSGNQSLIDVIAEVLDISYDAAHRRTSLKSKLSFEESIVLAKHFNISLDAMQAIGNNNIVAVEKTQIIRSQSDLEQYFNDSYENLSQLLKVKDAEIIYSAKDVPIFYTATESMLSTFKMYVWLQVLTNDIQHKAFREFAPSVSLVQAYTRLGKSYQNLKVSEIWDLTTINSTLKQIHFYYKAALLKEKEALLLCEDVKKLIATIAEKVANESSNYKLYYNELLLMNNTVLVKNKELSTLFVPYTILSYYKTTTQLTIAQMSAYFDKQMRNSKLLSTSGDKEQRMFFNKMYAKVDALIQLIKAETTLDFE